MFWPSPRSVIHARPQITDNRRTLRIIETVVGTIVDITVVRRPTEGDEAVLGLVQFGFDTSTATVDTPRIRRAHIVTVDVYATSVDVL